MKLDELTRVKSLLTQALSVAMHSMTGNSSVVEAKGHIRQAINNLDKVAKVQMQKRKVTETEYQNWWGNMHQVAQSNFTQEGSQRSLQQVNAMIEKQKNLLDELEKASENQADDQILTD